MLAKLIDEKVRQGLSYRDIGREAKVGYSSIMQYHKQEAEPRGENLAKLARYFNVHFADLLDDYVPGANLSPAKREILELLESATDEELQAVRVLLRKHHKQD